MLHRSTYRPLTQDELLGKDGLDVKDQFMARVYEKLGSRVLPRELEDIGLENTPQHDSCEDEAQNEKTFPHLAEETKPTPEVNTHFIRAEIL